MTLHSAPGVRVTYRNPNIIVWCGTSRIAAQYQDSTQYILSNKAWMNWTAGALRTQGKPWLTIGNYAVSGTRTDQFASQITTALTKNPSMIGMDGPVNDIAQNYPTAGTVAATALANLKSYIKQINDTGTPVIYVWERGANSFTAAQIGALNDFNRSMADYLQWGDDWRGTPNVIVVDPTPYTVTTSSNGTIALQNSADGTHDNVAAASKLGLNSNIVSQIGALLRPFPNHAMGSLNQGLPANGVRNLINTATGFTGTTAAAGGTGNTGSIPNYMSAFQSGGVTAAFTTQATAADANGNTFGNEIKLVCTATASGAVGFWLPLNQSLIQAGDYIRGGWEVDVASGATAVTGVQTHLETFPTTPSVNPTYDMYASGVGTDPGGYTKYAAEPPPLVMPSFTGTPFTNLRLDIAFSGAGSATVTIRKPWAERATS